MSMIWIDGVALPTPSSFTYGLSDISDSDSGRTDDAVMHKNRIAQKRTLNLSWNNPTKEVTATILTMVNPEYISVTYPDAMSGTNETRDFYVGDRTAPMYVWYLGEERYTTLSFNFIEV